MILNFAQFFMIKSHMDLTKKVIFQKLWSLGRALSDQIIDTLVTDSI